MIKKITIIGTKNNQGVIIKALFISANKTTVSASPFEFCVNPMMIKKINVIIIVGTVV